MSYKFPDNETWLPKGMKFKSFQLPSKRCGNCIHSFCPNPGANITALACKKIKFYLSRKTTKLKDKNEEGDKLHYTSIVSENDVCDRHKK